MADVLPFPALPLPDEPELPDAHARRQALDIRRSFIVEAPAGSGKTGLLIQRFLKLLADPAVTSPEQVLAITFTKKATAEMRDRVLAHLEAAQNEAPVGDSDFDRDTRSFALAVLERDRQLGWSLLTQPARLRIRTIDSLCAEISRMLPVLSGSGGRLSPVEQARPLYREGARRTLLQLGGSDTMLHASIREVLLHRDGNLADCEELIADMLGLREQWGELIWGMLPIEQRHNLEDAYLDANVLPRLEAAMDDAICAALTEVQRAFPPDILEELAEVAAELTGRSEGASLDERMAGCVGRRLPPQSCSADLEYWKALVHVLITPSGDSWRKSLNVRSYGVELAPSTKTKLLDILSRLSIRDELLELLCGLKDLPPARYPEDQWRVAKALFRVLNRAMVELQVVFAERNECDFTELSLLARHALSQNSGADDLAEALGSRLQHLLVDEMQDTSSSQYHLLEVLTRSWDAHSQTVFLVGDPRQSIYLFRQARVERFLRAIEEQRLGDLPLGHLKLTSNFRSQLKLVGDFNGQFSSMFPRSDALPYSDAEAVLPASEFAAGLKWHANIIPNANKTTNPTLGELQQQQRGRDAQEVVRIAREWFAKPLPPGRRKIRTGSGEQAPEPWRIAVLVRSRNHLGEIASALHEADVPMRAVNIEPLNERQEILDLTALTRTLLHPADRVAGLAVLRAPWCGVTLADLHRLTGGDDPALKDLSIARLLAERGALLDDESRRRVARVQAVLTAAAAQRGRLTTAQLVEKAWRTLGGDVLLTSAELANADRFFQLLAQLLAESQGSAEVSLNALDARLRELFAEGEIIAPEIAYVELLTIHKAKGLEWDVVVVPGLERPPDRGRPRLLAWTTLDSGDGDSSASVMLAPIAARGNDPDTLTKWLNGLHRKRELAEHKRLFYVACTRARQELHLFAAPMEGSKGEVKPKPATLLKAAWPAARQKFQQAPLPAFNRAVENEEPIEIAASAVEKPRSVAGLKRLPLAFDSTARFAEAERNRLAYGSIDESPSARNLFERPEGSFAARAFGNAIHASLELLSRRLAGGAAVSELQAEVRGWTPRISALLRADGLPRLLVERLTRDALGMVEHVLSDRDGLWILSPHPRAASEFSLTTASAPGGGISTVRADRVFNAGSTPHAPGDDFLWIIDYKTSAHGGTGLDTFLQRQREAYADQLETYARTLAPALGKDTRQVRVGLYFPAIPRLLWWDPTADS
jgi:ATP-dependent exoDNAse (exonuclease V) beta subunit